MTFILSHYKHAEYPLKHDRLDSLTFSKWSKELKNVSSLEIFGGANIRNHQLLYYGENQVSYECSITSIVCYFYDYISKLKIYLIFLSIKLFYDIEGIKQFKEGREQTPDSDGFLSSVMHEALLWHNFPSYIPPVN